VWSVSCEDAAIFWRIRQTFESFGLVRRRRPQTLRKQLHMGTLRQTIRRSSSLLRVLTPESSTRGFASSSSPSSSGVSFAGSTTQGSAVNTVLNVVPQSTAYVCIEIDRDVRSADCLTRSFVRSFVRSFSR